MSNHTQSDTTGAKLFLPWAFVGIPLAPRRDPDTHQRDELFQ